MFHYMCIVGDLCHDTKFRASPTIFKKITPEKLILRSSQTFHEEKTSCLSTVPYKLFCKYFESSHVDSLMGPR
jgi:hypothetical protein